MADPALDPRTGFHPDCVVKSIEVDIDAPVSVVWEVLTDLARYGEWNPFCIQAESTLALGAPVHMMCANLWKPGKFVPQVEYVCAFEPEYRLSWELRHTEEKPYAARRDQFVHAVGADKSRYLTTDAFLGATGPDVYKLVAPMVKAAFDATALAIKKRAETLYALRRIPRI